MAEVVNSNVWQVGPLQCVIPSSVHVSWIKGCPKVTAKDEAVRLESFGILVLVLSGLMFGERVQNLASQVNGAATGRGDGSTCSCEGCGDVRRAAGNGP